MAKRLKLSDIEPMADDIEYLIRQGKSKKEICEMMDLFMGSVDKYLRKLATPYIRHLAYENGRGV